MNKIVNQEERAVNLVEVARKAVSKLGPRNLAAALMLSSMLAFTGCGKKDEVTEQNVTVENTDNAKYRNRALGGGIVDNHNGELYISKADDIKSVVEGNDVEDNTKKGKNSSNTQNSSTAPATESNVVVDNNTSVEVQAPDLMPGETVTYSNDGSYVVEPSQDYVNPQEDNTPPTTEEPSTDVPSTEQPSDEEQVLPVVEEEFQGYVVRKLNYSDDTYFYTFTVNNGEYFAYLNDVEFANELSHINSNILALAKDDSELSYALAEHWVKVGLYNFDEYSFLDSVHNIEAVCDERVEAAIKAIEEADKEATQGLGLGL